MARVKVPIVVTNSATGLPVNGASVALSLRSSGAAATWFSTESGGTGSTASIATDASGRLTAWVPRGAYNATISGTGITTYTESFDAATASDASVDQAWTDPAVLLPGEVKMYAGLVVPTGWLVCDGSLVSRTTYASLFSAIGTAFGAGDGSTTFNLPDFRGRSPVGSGTGSGLSARVRGQTGGEESHLMAAAESGVNSNGVAASAGSHSHGGSVAPETTDHVHSSVGGQTFVTSGVGGTAGSIGMTIASGGFVGLDHPATTTTGRSSSHTHTISADGVHTHSLTARAADSAANVMHPFAVVNFVIKT